MIKPLSREFLIARGYCCGMGCINCPYGEQEMNGKGDRQRPVDKDKFDANYDSIDWRLENENCAEGLSSSCCSCDGGICRKQSSRDTFICRSSNGKREECSDCRLFREACESWQEGSCPLSPRRTGEAER